MNYVLGAMAGLLLGGAVGYLKNRFIWGKYLQRDVGDAAVEGESSALYSRLLISNIVNLVTLLAAFFLRNLFPFNGAAFIIGVAAALTVMNRLLSMGQKKREDERKEACGQ